jgi:hypothetical protein
VQALAETGVSQFIAESCRRERDSSSGGSDGEQLSIRVAPLRRGDQLVAAEAPFSMIN